MQPERLTFPDPRDEPLWLQSEAATFLRVSESYLRRSSCPKHPIPSNRPGGRAMIRYVPDEVREWALRRQQRIRRAS